MNLPYFEKEKKKKKKFWKTVPSFYLTQFFFETNIKNLKENKYQVPTNDDKTNSRGDISNNQQWSHRTRSER